MSNEQNGGELPNQALMDDSSARKQRARDRRVQRKKGENDANAVTPIPFGTKKPSILPIVGPDICRVDLSSLRA